MPVCLYSNTSLPRISTQAWRRSEEHTSELQSRGQLVCRPLLHTTTPAPDHTTLSLHDALPILSNLLGRQLIIPSHTAIDVPTGLHKRMSGPVTVGAGVNHARHACVLILEHFVAENKHTGMAEIGRAHV